MTLNFTRRPFRHAAAAVALALICLVAGCNFPSARPTVPPTDEPTLTLAPTGTFTPTSPPSPTHTLPPPTRPPPTATFSPSPTVPTATSGPTATITPTENLTPTQPPIPTVAFVGDRFEQVDLIRQVREGVGRTWVSFITINDAKPTGTPGTPTGLGDTESVYLVSPDGSTRLKVIDLPATTDQRVYWSPNGAYMAYLILEGDGRGLYVLDIANATTTRLFAIRDFSPRGFPIQPVWAPDSSRIALMLPAPYDMDIYSIAPDGRDFTNLAPSGGYDLWPAWSPDGAYIAFVSDRNGCPSWVPGETGTCATADGKVPDGGNLYLLDTVTKEVRMLSNQWVGAPPHWVNANRIAFLQTRPDDPAAGTSLWYADLRGGSAKQVTAGTNTASPRFATGDAWSPDGARVLVQESDSSTRLVLRSDAGTEVARNTDLNFPRYLFAAAWSPNGMRIAIGGRNGQCPFGMILTDDSLKVLLNASGGTPGVCDPQWSPDGRWILYVGTTRGTGSNIRDGRVDVYTAEASGYGARVLSSRLSGQIKLLGWVRGNP